MKRFGQSLTKFAVSVLFLAFAGNGAFAFYGNDLVFSKTLLGTNVWKGDWQVKTIDERKALEIEKIVEAQEKERKPVTPYAGVIPAVFEKYVTAVADTVNDSGQSVKAVLVPGSVLVFNDSGKFEAYFLDAPSLRVTGSWEILDGDLRMTLDRDYCAPYEAGYEFKYKVEKNMGGGSHLKLSGSPIEDLKKIVVASAQAQMEGKEVLGYSAPKSEAAPAAKTDAAGLDALGEKTADEESADTEEEDSEADAEGAEDDGGKAAAKADDDDAFEDEEVKADPDDTTQAPEQKSEDQDGAEANQADDELSAGW